MDYKNELKKQLVKMLKENTGTSFLDSGSAYGRHFEKNKTFKNFDKLPAITYEINTDKNENLTGFYLTMDLYHYLSIFVELNSETDKLNTEFKKLCDANPEDSYFDLVEMFTKNKDISNLERFNTYNEDTIFSQDFEYAIFEYKDCTYMFISIHNGCDIRGGYTTPYIFAVTDIDMAYNIGCYIDGKTFETDDNGWSWIDSNDYKKADLLPLLKVENGKLLSKETGKEIEFDVIYY